MAVLTTLPVAPNLLNTRDNFSGNFPGALNCEVRSQYWITD